MLTSFDNFEVHTILQKSSFMPKILKNTCNFDIPNKY